jgi:hypothetical protein
VKRAIQGLLVTSILLAGCAGANPEATYVDSTNKSTISPQEVADIRENLLGICKAISEYGMPVDGEVRRWVKRKFDILVSAVEAADDEETTSPTADRSLLIELSEHYERCEPFSARQMKDSLESLGST